VADCSWAWAALSAVSQGVGSILPITWPFFTRLLKSAVSEVTTPETWVPTGTWIRALRVPVAVIRWVMLPISTLAVRHLISS